MLNNLAHKISTFISVCILIMTYFLYQVLSTPEITTTDIVIKSFYDKDGMDVLSSLKMNKEVTAKCWSGSLSNPRPDAWRCVTENESEILDPCFSNTMSTSAICLSDPWTNEYTKVNLSEPINQENSNSDNFFERGVWAIELKSGERCIISASTGAAGKSIAGLFNRSICYEANGAPSSLEVYGDVLTNTDLVTVFTKKNESDLVVSEVVKIWY